MDKIKKITRRRAYEATSIIQGAIEKNENMIIRIANDIVRALKKNKKVLLFGNGGSAADSQHLAAELIGRFQKERKSLSAIALTTDTSIITALSNDYSFDIIFSRQIEGLGQRGDIAIGFSTSGNSRNVIEAFKKARSMGIKTVSFTGCGGGKLAKVSDISLIVPSKVTARIQEAHICMAHIICELVEKNFK